MLPNAAGPAGILARVEGHEGLDELETYLAEAEILTWGEAVTEGGHPEKHRVILAGGVQVMAKPGFDQYEDMVKREVAGWRVAKHLGFTGLVAATVLRDVPRLSTGDPALSSVQVTWPDGRQWLTPLDQFTDEETWRAATFDAIVAHTDHRDNNWFGVPDPSTGRQPHLRLVDTANAFTGNQPNSSFYERHVDEQLPEDITDGLQRLLDDGPSDLEDLLGDADADRVRLRADEILAARVLRIG